MLHGSTRVMLMSSSGNYSGNICIISSHKHLDTGNNIGNTGLLHRLIHLHRHINRGHYMINTDSNMYTGKLQCIKSFLYAYTQFTISSHVHSFFRIYPLQHYIATQAKQTRMLKCEHALNY